MGDRTAIGPPNHIEVVFGYADDRIRHAVGVRELHEVGGRSTLNLYVVHNGALCSGRQVVLRYRSLQPYDV